MNRCGIDADACSVRGHNMVEKATPRRQRCVAIRHDRHLCHLTDRYFHIRCPERFRTMVLDPQYACEFCGRTAHNARNLCYPMPL